MHIFCGIWILYYGPEGFSIKPMHSIHLCMYVHVYVHLGLPTLVTAVLNCEVMQKKNLAVTVSLVCAVGSNCIPA